jgi:hypothetical protein
MSTKYERCPKSVSELATFILKQYESYLPVVNAGVTVDFVFAIAETNEKTGEPKGPSMKKNGHQILGKCRATSLKDRSLGHSDAEITIDKFWWETATEDEQAALLDHELHHIQVIIDKRGLKRDDLGRPVVKMRYHDVECGFFKLIAQRHGIHSQERKQAAQIMCEAGQYFWPALSKLVEADPKLVTQ